MLIVRLFENTIILLRTYNMKFAPTNKFNKAQAPSIRAVSPIHKKLVKAKCNFCTPGCPKITDDFLLEFHYSLLNGPCWSFEGEKDVDELEIDTFGSNFELLNFSKSMKVPTQEVTPVTEIF